MANVIDISYFIGDITLPQDVDDLTTALNRAISRTEKWVMRSLLGDTLYKKYVDSDAAYTAFFTALIEGATVTLSSGDVIIWEGLRGDDATKENSVFAYFTFAEFLQEDYYNFTRGGVNTKRSENSKTANPQAKIAMASQKGWQLYGRIGNDVLAATAYNFIINGEYYDLVSEDWRFEEICPINQFGI